MNEHKWQLTEDEFGTPYYEDIDPDHLERVLRERKEAQHERLRQNNIANRMGNLIVKALRQLAADGQVGAVETLEDALDLRKEGRPKTVSPKEWLKRLDAEPAGENHPCSHPDPDLCDCRGACSCHFEQTKAPWGDSPTGRLSFFDPKMHILPPQRMEEGTRLKELIGKTLGEPVKGSIPIELLNFDFAALERSIARCGPNPRIEMEDGWVPIETVMFGAEVVSLMAAKCVDGIGVLAYWRRTWNSDKWELWIVDTEKAQQMDQTYDQEQGEVPLLPPIKEGRP